MLKPMIDEKMLTGPRNQDPDMFYQYLILFCLSEVFAILLILSVFVKCIKAVSES